MACFRANAEKVVWRIVDGEAVLVHADTSAYYGLNPTGTFVWQAIAEASLAPEEIARRLSIEYGVGHDAVLGDIEAFLATVGREALVVEDPAADITAADDKPVAKDAWNAVGHYKAPRLTRFGELEKLVLSGE